MDAAKVRELIEDLPAGTAIKLKYLKECVLDPTYLLGMQAAGIIRFENPYDEDLIVAVAQSRDWKHDENRVITIVTTEAFNIPWFVGRVARRIEQIEIIKKQ